MFSPIETMKQYVECFDDSNEVKTYMQSLLDNALSSTEADCWSSTQRTDLIFFCRQTQLLFDAFFAAKPLISEMHLMSKSCKE